ncbi:MAG TPA: NUDIX hydrolase [Chitinophagaceae bacterium]|nr:NUDIX hydrolase [Chitinophagaceae bacterium]
MNEAHNPWTITNSDKKYDNNWISLTHYDVINPSGNNGIYGKVHFKNLAIGVVLLDEEFNTYLVGQYRFAIDKYSWEIPEGGGPFGETPLESAKRELAEETGLHASEWTELLQIHLSNSVTDEVGYIYLARGLSQYEAAPEETEQLIIKKLPLAEAIEMVDGHIITDSLSVAGLLKVKLMMLEGKL